MWRKLRDAAERNRSSSPRRRVRHVENQAQNSYLDAGRCGACVGDITSRRRLGCGTTREEADAYRIVPQRGSTSAEYGDGHAPAVLRLEPVQWELGGSATCATRICILAVDAYNWSRDGGTIASAKSNIWKDRKVNYYLV